MTSSDQIITILMHAHKNIRKLKTLKWPIVKCKFY